MSPTYSLKLLAFLSILPFAVLAEAPLPKVQVKTEMVSMRDGVKLATDIYLPEKLDGKLPTILTRTPYNKTGAKNFGEYFARNGYVFVAQDVRGRWASEGTWHWVSDDGPDGVDCAAWIGKQEWSDGKIGMLGTSYVGGTQHAMALAGAKELATVIPVDAISNCGVQSVRNAGAFEMRFWNWIMINGGRGSNAARDEGTEAVLKEMSDNRFTYLSLLPLRHGMIPLQLSPEYESWIISAMRHGANDDFWKPNNIIDHASDYKDIPVYLVGGWYDSWAGNTTANFKALTPVLKSDVYLIMGPWIHGAQARSVHGMVDFGKEAAIPDEKAWRLEWYDHALKGKDNSVGKAAPFAKKVRYFTMGTGDGHKTEQEKLFHGGEWHDSDVWPPQGTEAVNFYLQSDGSLSKKAPAETKASTSFTYDPANPVPTIGGNISSGNDILLQGAWDQRGGEHVWNWPKPVPLSARNDILVFQTEPLTEDVEVTGELEVKLWISSDCVDTDFTAKLLDIYPPSKDYPGGFDLNIADGICRARFRDSLKEEKLMEPGQIYPLTVRLYPTSNVFKKGHRIRVDISSSNFPRFDLNPNTGEPLQQHRQVKVAVNTIHQDADHPSYIILPIRKR